MSFQLIFLGSGTSAGVPMIACDCAVCTSADPRDQRDRSSVVVRYDQQNWLIDASPELRVGAVRHQIHDLAGVLFTHAHADHVLGIDDLRRFNAAMKSPIDIYAEPRVLDRLRLMFEYIFEPHRNINPSFVATLVAHPIEPGERLQLGGATWTVLRLMHGNLPIVGFRVDYAGRSLAYCTDVSAMPDETLEQLRGLDVLVIDALRRKPHPTHLTVEQALAIIDRAGCQRAYLTHIAHDVSHADLQRDLPAHVQPAHDGLVVELMQ